MGGRPSYDAVVLGAGPAGSTLGRLLTEWGHSVLILGSPSQKHARHAVCMPPSCRKLFRHLGILNTIDEAGFYRTTGNTSWWQDGQKRIEYYPGPAGHCGYQACHEDLDALLLEAAQRSGTDIWQVSATEVDIEDEAGVRVDSGPPGTGESVYGRFVLDCTGRAGVLARRGLRKNDGYPPTIALLGSWERQDGWPVDDPTHTLIEAYGDGWVWSIPVSPTTRHVAVMVDPRASNLDRAPNLAQVYEGELSKTRVFRDLLKNAQLREAPWGCDASVYGTSAFSGSNFLLVGDAAFTLDPLSSFGVKKALASAWLGAVAVHTCLESSEMKDASLQFYAQHENEILTVDRKRTAQYFREGNGQGAFWSERTKDLVGGPYAESVEEQLADGPDLQAALQELRERGDIEFRLGKGVHLGKKAGIEDRRIVLEDAVMAPAVPTGIRHLWGVNLPALVQVSKGRTGVPAIIEAYGQARPGVGFEQVLGALAFLASKGILETSPVLKGSTHPAPAQRPG